MKPRTHDLIPIDQLRQLLTCDAATGTLIWNKRQGSLDWWNAKYAGKIAGSIDNTGYRRVLIGQRRYVAHWIVYALTKGRWPVDQLDHINNKRDDNRFSNLREATNQLNSVNRLRNKNQLLPKGVYFQKSSKYKFKKYTAQICVNRKIKFLGCFLTVEDAAEAYRRAAAATWGDFTKGEI
jgi:hypothetical protein